MAKRKEAADQTSDTVPAPMPKHRKADGTDKRKGKRKGKAATVPEAPRPARLNRVVAAKVRKMLDFLDGEPESVLVRLPENEKHAIVTQSLLESAITGLMHDFRVGGNKTAVVGDVQEAIIKTFDGKVGTRGVSSTFIVLDFEASTKFEDAIHDKLQGHKLEESNLLEVELEMHTSAVEEAAKFGLLKFYGAGKASEEQAESDQSPLSEADGPVVDEASKQQGESDQILLLETDIPTVDEASGPKAEGDQSRLLEDDGPTIDDREHAIESDGVAVDDREYAIESDGVTVDGGIMRRLSSTETFVHNDQEVDRIGVCPAPAAQ